MNYRWHWVLFALLLSACAKPGSFDTRNASGYVASDNEQCVPFARNASGIEIYGNAASWWYQAQPRYARGQIPQEGAVLVLKATQKLRHGHLAVVTDVRNAREITVTHSNWGDTEMRRRRIYESMLVEDISPKNNWTNLRFWNKETNTFGRPYPAYGFIYAERSAPPKPASASDGILGFLPDWF